ncbi:MAG TPA: glutamate-5-semialdehyde dehydrogenase [Candidatus Acidoferrales bacterium]|nr:glutamate-5-semialdehyde dehydrogenase [Candidatus Acidoferrales bacterium]
MNVRETVVGLCQAARQAARATAMASTKTKNRCLRDAAARLRTACPRLLEANGEDVRRGRDAGLSSALIDRLTLTEARVEAMAKGLEDVGQLPDPVGETIAQWRRPNGLEIGQVRIPLGVVGIIYESRPNVTADAAALCLKAGNAVVLKGGSEALATNTAIAAVLSAAAADAGLPAAAVQLIPTTEREAVQVLLRQSQYIDVIVPRGGESLIRAITESSSIPVIQHYAGVCHTYVDEHADLQMAERICFNAKVQRPAVCNAMENMLVHAAVAPQFLPAMIGKLRAAGVEIRGCERARRIVGDVQPATEQDWRTEYLDLILAVKVIDSLDAAIAFINTHGTGHSDAIVTEHYAHARRFLAEVDSAAVYVNASTRFTDGYEFGFGAEVGISTNRLHARGPMGLRELTTYKYVVQGSGQIRE